MTRSKRASSKERRQKLETAVTCAKVEIDMAMEMSANAHIKLQFALAAHRKAEQELLRFDYPSLFKKRTDPG